MDTGEKVLIGVLIIVIFLMNLFGFFLSGAVDELKQCQQIVESYESNLCKSGDRCEIVRVEAGND